MTRPFAVLGCGSVGRAFAAELAAAGLPLRLWSRRPERARELAEDLPGPVAPCEELADALAGAAAALLCVSDPALEGFARRCAEEAPASGPEGRPVALHTNGFFGPAVLAPMEEAGWATGRLHPLVALPPRDSDAASPASKRPLAGAWFALDGSPEARAEGERIVAAAGGRTVTPRAGEGGAYHAAATLLSPGLVALFDAAGGVLADAVEEDAATARAALLGLLRTTVENLARLDPDAALTGAAARGAVEVVAGHLAALDASDPAAAALYRSLAARSVELAFGRGALGAAERDRLSALLRP